MCSCRTTRTTTSTSKVDLSKTLVVVASTTTSRTTTSSSSRIVASSIFIPGPFLECSTRTGAVACLTKASPRISFELQHERTSGNITKSKRNNNGWLTTENAKKRAVNFYYDLTSDRQY